MCGTIIPKCIFEQNSYIVEIAIYIIILLLVITGIQNMIIATFTKLLPIVGIILSTLLYYSTFAGLCWNQFELQFPILLLLFSFLLTGLSANLNRKRQGITKEQDFGFSQSAGAIQTGILIFMIFMIYIYTMGSCQLVLILRNV